MISIKLLRISGIYHRPNNQICLSINESTQCFTTEGNVLIIDKTLLIKPQLPIQISIKIGSEIVKTNFDRHIESDYQRHVIPFSILNNTLNLVFEIKYIPNKVSKTNLMSENIKNNEGALDKEIPEYYTPRLLACFPYL